MGPMVHLFVYMSSIICIDCKSESKNGILINGKFICKICESTNQAERIMSEQENFDRFGGDPHDETTWFGNEPDRQLPME